MLHPALPEAPDHALWQRDFTGVSGVFSFVLKPVAEERLHAMLKALDLFAMGFSWGGFESLIVPCDQQVPRSVVRWQAEGPLIRVSVGLEHVDDLIADLERGFGALV